tara:strand:- start:845 stop:2107 length:1263 start_codon:yes stop_codon:yes gene_type:complete
MNAIDNDLLKFNRCDIFTPDKISLMMTSFLTKKGNLLEPAVGTGNLLKFINYNDYTNIDIYDIKQEYLDKCDNDTNIKKYNTDFIKSDITTSYKNIILNPPYIRFQDLSIDYRKFIKEKWNILSKGNIDLYYAFIIKCIELLDDCGVMVAIIPNSYLYNKSAFNLRKYLIDNKFIKEIIDFKSEKVFNNISTYCCITVFTKSNKESLKYNNDDIQYNNISTDEYNIFSKNNTINNSIKLGNICNIKNGIATLRDKIYIHKHKLFDEPVWQIITNSKEDKWIIYPYKNGVIMDELEFKKYNPKTYNYLLSNKDELLKRDKGNKKYPKWYSFGRTQSIIKAKSNKVIYVSTFTDPDNICYNIDTSKLCVSSLSIELINTNYTLNNIIDILKKNNDFIKQNSSKRGGGWINISGRILKQIPII